MKIHTEINPGDKVKSIEGKKLINANGHAGRKLYKVAGEYHEVLLICLKGEVIEVVCELSKQPQRIQQGW